jgi:ABC-type polysaccharide/polyol phosphate export permease
MAILINEFMYNWILFRRYFVNSLFGIITLMIVFYGLLFGSRFVANADTLSQNNIETSLVNFFLWLLVLTSFSSISTLLIEEFYTGTLETLMLAFPNLTILLLFRSLTNLIFALSINLFVLIIMLLFTSIKIHLSFSLIVPAIGLILTGYGFGYVVAAVALKFRQISSITNLLQFCLLFVISIPATLFSEFLPFIMSASLVRNITFSHYSPRLFEALICLFNGLIYFTFGILIFRHILSVVKKTQRLNGY